MTAEEAEQFVVTMADAKNRIRSCPVCGNICEGDLCHICADPRRDPSLICVVEDVKAILAMERVKDFNGVYHVLGGTISPIDGRGPDDIAIAPLLKRVAQGGVSEVIVATNPTLDGDTTAMYLSKLLKSKGIKTTRLAYGIPVGGDLDYADEMTLLRAMDGRKEL
jgi:recombination protein RecR